MSGLWATSILSWADSASICGNLYAQYVTYCSLILKGLTWRKYLYLFTWCTSALITLGRRQCAESNKTVRPTAVQWCFRQSKTQNQLTASLKTALLSFIFTFGLIWDEFWYNMMQQERTLLEAVRRRSYFGLWLCIPMKSVIFRIYAHFVYWQYIIRLLVVMNPQLYHPTLL